jgi:hypothetical protein
LRNAMVNQPVEVSTLRPQFASAMGIGGGLGFPSSTLPSHLPPPSGSLVYPNQQLAIAKVAIFEFFCSANL